MVPAQRYLTAIQERLAALAHDELRALDDAGRICAEAIAAGGVVHVFGAGHSRMAAEEAYPRIGAVVGFRPVVELALSHFHEVVGPNGLDQAIFLERIPGYGQVIYDNLRTRPSDVLLIVSSSGLEAVIMDLADAARKDGVTVIGVTSVEYSTAAAARRGGATRLADVADLLIDNHVPVGDALVEIDGLDERVAASASILNLAAIDAVTAATAGHLVALGVTPYVFPSPHLVGQEASAARYRECLDAYERHVQRRQPADEPIPATTRTQRTEEPR